MGNFSSPNLTGSQNYPQRRRKKMSYQWTPVYKVRYGLCSKEENIPRVST